jgi:N-glycosylase/DNA lyase
MTHGFQALPLPIVQLSLAAVLKCGQSFRWSIFPLFPCLTTPGSTADPTHEYRLCLRDRVVCLRQSPSTLFYRSVYPDPQPNPTQLALRDAETLVWLRDYFQLEVDLVALYDEWGMRDVVFRGVRERFMGIRMLRQDPWENLVSCVSYDVLCYSNAHRESSLRFICSSNNNISRITKMVQSLCKKYSPPLLLLPDPFASSISGEPEERTYHPFPAPSVLAAPDVGSTLRSLGFGYRAEFIQRTAAMLVDTHGPSSSDSMGEASETWLKNLREVSTDEAREELLKFVGVGRKVADCVLLMSLDKVSSLVHACHSFKSRLVDLGRGK